MTTAWKALLADVTREHLDGRTRVRCELRERTSEPRLETVDLVVFSKHTPASSRPLAMHVARPREVFAGLVATLAPETRHRLAQWLQPDPETGDTAFDDDVLISTKQPEATLRFLSRPEVRADLLTLTKTGTVQFDGRAVLVELAGRVTDDPPALRRLLEAYSGFARG